MNCAHVVDVWINVTTDQVVVIRRFDMTFWGGVGCGDSRLLGAVVKDGLKPVRKGEFDWVPCLESAEADEAEEGGWQIVVVWRAEGRLIVTTPYCHWGKAPNIELPAQPRSAELGEAILAQAKYAAGRNAL